MCFDGSAVKATSSPVVEISGAIGFVCVVESEIVQSWTCRCDGRLRARLVRLLTKQRFITLAEGGRRIQAKCSTMVQRKSSPSQEASSVRREDQWHQPRRLRSTGDQRYHLGSQGSLLPRIPHLDLDGTSFFSDLPNSSATYTSWKSSLISLRCAISVDL